jgi:hypothetical protein
MNLAAFPKRSKVLTLGIVSSSLLLAITCEISISYEQYIVILTSLVF